MDFNWFQLVEQVAVMDGLCKQCWVTDLSLLLLLDEMERIFFSNEEEIVRIVCHIFARIENRTLNNFQTAVALLIKHE